MRRNPRQYEINGIPRILNKHCLNLESKYLKRRKQIRKTGLNKHLLSQNSQETLRAERALIPVSEPKIPRIFTRADGFRRHYKEQHRKSGEGARR